MGGRETKKRGGRRQRKRGEKEGSRGEGTMREGRRREERSREWSDSREHIRPSAKMVSLHTSHLQ